MKFTKRIIWKRCKSLFSEYSTMCQETGIVTLDLINCHTTSWPDWYFSFKEEETKD